MTRKINIILLLCLSFCFSSCCIHYYGRPFFEDIRGAYCSDIIYIENPKIVCNNDDIYICDSSKVHYFSDNVDAHEKRYAYSLLSNDKIIMRDFAGPSHPYNLVNYFKSKYLKRSWRVIYDNLPFIDNHYFNLETSTDSMSVYSFKERPKHFLLFFVPQERTPIWIEDVLTEKLSTDFMIELLPIYTKHQQRILKKIDVY